MFQVSVPIPIDDTALDASNIPENDHAAWGSGPTYALGDRVILASTHKIYESVQGGNTNRNPATAANIGVWWVVVGPTNRWRPFDQAIGSLATKSGDIFYRLLAGFPVDTLHMFGLAAGRVQVQVYDTDVIRRNLLTFSEELDNANHTKTEVTIGANATGDPFGAQQADLLVETVAASNHFLQASDVAYTSGVPYSFSAYIGQFLGTRNVALQLPAAAFVGNPNVVINPSTGAIVAGPTDCTVVVTPVALTDYYRVTISATADATVTAHGGIVAMLDGTTASYTGTLRSVKVFGLMTNVGGVVDYQWIRGASVFGNLSYNQSIDLTALGPSGTEAAFHDLPCQAGDYIGVAIYANNGTAQVGEIVPGLSYQLGKLVAPTEVGILDFTRQDRDDFGNITVIRRGYARRNVYTVLLNKSDTRQVLEFLAFLRGVICVWHDDEIPSGFGVDVLGIAENSPFPLTENSVVFLSLTVSGRA